MHVPIAVALVGTLLLAGCDTHTTAPTLRSLQPLSEKVLTEIEQKNMTKESAILIRIFKEESELEVWKEDKNGRFALLRVYPICRWSGELGPKIKEGDRQAPEGFYTITPGQMNPNSSLYLSFNLGFPNAFDRAHGRSGAHLMVHGDCSSSGCYAVTDEQISEIYALARESFFGGQQSFQVQAFPFRMTPLNMAKHRNSPHLAFWQMLKQGNDHFEVTKLQPKVDVCEKRYVFDAEPSGKFSAMNRCPVYRIPQDVAAAVAEKQRRDEIQTATLVSRGTPTMPVRTGADGGMNQIFLAALKSRGGPGANVRTAVGTIPAHVNPPAEALEAVVERTTSFVSTDSSPAPAPRSPVQVRAAAPTEEVRKFFGNLFGSKSDGEQSTGLSRSAADSPIANPKPAPVAVRQAHIVTVEEIRPKQSPDRRPKASAGTTEPHPAPQLQQTNVAVRAEPALNPRLIKGAQPMVRSDGFENRFGAWR